MQNKPNLRKAAMFVTSYITKDYENEPTRTTRKTNPIQTQTKPICLPPATKQTQFKPKTNPIKPNPPTDFLHRLLPNNLPMVIVLSAEFGYPVT
jgi:hypothetical protein